MREADNLTTLMCQMSWKSGSLNLLETSGPHRACYGTPLPLPFLSGIFLDFKISNNICVCVLLNIFFIIYKQQMGIIEYSNL